MVLEKTLESPLDCKEIQPVHPKGDQSWAAESRGAPPPPQDPSPLRGTLASSLRTPAEGEGHDGPQMQGLQVQPLVGELRPHMLLLLLLSHFSHVRLCATP